MTSLRYHLTKCATDVWNVKPFHRITVNTVEHRYCCEKYSHFCSFCCDIWNVKRSRKIPVKSLNIGIWNTEAVFNHVLLKLHSHKVLNLDKHVKSKPLVWLGSIYLLNTSEKNFPFTKHKFAFDFLKQSMPIQETGPIGKADSLKWIWWNFLHILQYLQDM